MKTMVQIGTLRLDDIAPAPIYQPFQGGYAYNMPTLRAEGRIPMLIPAHMKRRLQVLKSGNEELVNAWWENYFDSPDGVACKGDEVKYVPNAQLLLSITPNAELSNGALVLTEKQYDGLLCQTFSRKELQKAGLNEWLTKNQVLNHPVWQAVAGSELLEQYADAHFKRYDAKTAMGVYLSSSQDRPTMRTLILNYGDYHRSNLDGGRGLGGDIARLVGVREGLEGKVA